MLRGPAMVKGMFGGGGRVVCEQSSSEGTQMGCLRTLLIVKTKLKLFKAQRMRGGASSEVLRRLECAFAGALIDYLITSISARSTSDRSSHHVAELQSYSKQQPGVEQATPLCCITAPPP